MEIKIDEKVVKQFIDQKIRAVIAEALGKDPKALVDAVVKSALEKKSGSYRHETVFQEAIDEMIRKEAEATFKRWIKNHRATIRNAIERRMKMEKSEFFEKIANQLVDQMATKFHVSVWLKKDD